MSSIGIERTSTSASRRRREYGEPWLLVKLRPPSMLLAREGLPAIGPLRAARCASCRRFPAGAAPPCHHRSSPSRRATPTPPAANARSPPPAAAPVTTHRSCSSAPTRSRSNALAEICTIRHPREAGSRASPSQLLATASLPPCAGRCPAAAQSRSASPPPPAARHASGSSSWPLVTAPAVLSSSRRRLARRSGSPLDLSRGKGKGNAHRLGSLLDPSRGKGREKEEKKWKGGGGRGRLRDGVL